MKAACYYHSFVRSLAQVLFSSVTNFYWSLAFLRQFVAIVVKKSENHIFMQLLFLEQEFFRRANNKRSKRAMERKSESKVEQRMRAKRGDKKEIEIENKKT